MEDAGPVADHASQLGAVAGLARMGGEDAQASPSPSPPADQAVAMKAAADLTPWTFTIDEAYAYGERACEDIRDPSYDGFGGFYMGVRKTWVAMRLDAHGLSSEEQVEHHRRLYAEAVRSLCPELLPQVPPLYRRPPTGTGRRRRAHPPPDRPATPRGRGSGGVSPRGSRASR
ncbi:hypothetical protein [Dietzia sp. Alg238-R159]|uniref:hypothetical protein n=1 Tax=Dietzia sp. Alg238-R159 TaxID=2305986 RepID=UPI0013D65662|nr:hypothetical protein [Dietzia sp. Alg238-R159]